MNLTLSIDILINDILMENKKIKTIFQKYGQLYNDKYIIDINDLSSFLLELRIKTKNHYEFYVGTNSNKELCLFYGVDM